MIKFSLSIRETDNGYLISSPSSHGWTYDTVETHHPAWEAVLKHIQSVTEVRKGPTQNTYKKAVLELETIKLGEKIKKENSEQLRKED